MNKRKNNLKWGGVGLIIGICICFLFFRNSELKASKRNDILIIDYDKINKIIDIYPLIIFAKDVCEPNGFGEGGFATFSFLAEGVSESKLLSQGFSKLSKAAGDSSVGPKVGEYRDIFSWTDIHYGKLTGTQGIGVIVIPWEENKSCVFLSSTYTYFNSIK